jgi:hypothetical protein
MNSNAESRTNAFGLTAHFLHLVYEADVHRTPHPSYFSLLEPCQERGFLCGRKIKDIEETVSFGCGESNPGLQLASLYPGDIKLVCTVHHVGVIHHFWNPNL